MADYQFGNYLYQLRKDAKITQDAVASALNVTNKAVSKWENGMSKPTIDKLKKLAKLFNVSMDELLDLYNEDKSLKITKIVLTGGPCAGKTTALTWINNYFSKIGYKVIIVPETATDLIPNGVAPWTCETNYDYQLLHIRYQKFKEELFLEAAKSLKDAQKVLIVCDRGILDNKAYMKPQEFKSILKSLNTNEVKERDSYDAVFHLVTAAYGKEKAYTLANNKARYESIENAREVDDKIVAAWVGHPHLRIIDNSTEFEEKLERLIKEITGFLGEPEPLEIERKYLISYPDINELESLPNCQKVEIIQNYLKSDDNNERRIRARGIDGNYMYYLTEKRKLSNIKRVEVERRLTQEEYLRLLMDVDNNLKAIHKTRYCLIDNNRYFEIDIYPERKHQAIMEIELNDEKEEVIFPSFIKVIKEVTDDDSYKNSNLAKKMPCE